MAVDRKAKDCPDCGSNDVGYRTGGFTGDYYVKCKNCGLRGEYRQTLDEAILEWNAKPTKNTSKVRKVKE